jgi:hypothetical protein
MMRIAYTFNLAYINSLRYPSSNVQLARIRAFYIYMQEMKKFIEIEDYMISEEDEIKDLLIKIQDIITILALKSI